jgi:chromosome partitioning protein
VIAVWPHAGDVERRDEASKHRCSCGASSTKFGHVLPLPPDARLESLANLPVNKCAPAHFVVRNACARINGFAKEQGTFMDLMGQMSHWIIDKFLAAVIVIPALGYIGWLLCRYVAQLSLHAWLFVRSRRRALQAVGRQVDHLGAHEGGGVWLTTPIDQPRDYRRDVAGSRVLAVANLKGGVGKTTLAANIGACLARDWQKRVLLIDLDFQGSLSSMAFPGKDWLPGEHQSSLATRLISGDVAPADVPLLAQDVDLKTGDNGSDENGPGRLQVVAAYYDLAQADNRIMIEWLLQCIHFRPGDLRHALIERLKGNLLRTADVRYTLAKVLHSDIVQRAFDLIIIDCPPRLTTSAIQAFCAASHVLIPTIFDRPSAEAVVSLYGQIETLKRVGICPRLEYMGVVGTMWKRGRVSQTEAITFVKDALGNGSIGILPEKTFVPHAAALVNDAPEGIAHLVMPNGRECQQIRTAIAELAEHVADRMGISRTAHFLEAAE